ncbi:carboxylating nicotinate-nucleotide diphosphorylase [Streptomyces corynorhini]|uniref:Nicotinate-nucleotide pyrophosphorylase [carboxylating] n=1 Tax=Streptomyces corynorhini TaxID=2282652 RepID=A0A370BDT5_9ACTN|nr:carboxylating nicotinate-nucleotide diphosphorylase [Streptomyces corynorhini]RDG39801.1 carboxylating nicotinate-nucleotide diphosphorylase [Streptomyces corynorhini]
MPTTWDKDVAARAVAAALAEDATGDDITTRWSVPENRWLRAEIFTRRRGVAAGVPLVAEVYAQVDPRVQVTPRVPDGARLLSGDVLLSLEGPARSLISGERTALNFLQRMSGIATLTAAYVEALGGAPVRVLDSRKTAPGLRALDKYAVTAGGGHNHRLDLSAMVLLKENHIAAAGGLGAAVRAVRAGAAEEGRDVVIETEVRDVREAKEALENAVPWIMLDNMSPQEVAEVVRMRAEHGDAGDTLLEASGTITLARVSTYARTGVDAISVGALTHSAPALDLSMLVREVLTP